MDRALLRKVLTVISLILAVASLYERDLPLLTAALVIITIVLLIE